MQDFSAIKLRLASPEDILSWSYGEVKTSETINYRSLKAEPGGLMCERIFGPTKDYECYCGKYRKKKYKGIVCDKCGVEVTTSKVRRERMGHIKLAVPVVHVWYAYGVPCKLSILLSIPSKKLVSVIYYIRYIITEIDESRRQAAIDELLQLQAKEIEEVEASHKDKINESEKSYAVVKKKLSGKKVDPKEVVNLEKQLEELGKAKALLKKDLTDEKTTINNKYDLLKDLVQKLQYKDIINEDEYRLLTSLSSKFYVAEMGAGAIEKLLGDINFDELKQQLEAAYNLSKGAQRLQVERRLKLIEGFIRNAYDPRWLVMKVIPVLPADLRPIVPLAGGRFAISDHNDLYRRVINRNNRLNELMEIGAPEIILRNEKRMLQEAFDALIDNQHRFNKPVLNRNGIPYKSLTESLRGKKGRFRRNLLGKRVDYSGRAVIIPDTNLRLEQCGLPKLLALEIFKPFMVHRMMAKGIATTIKEAKDLIEAYDERVWDILEEVISERTVLLNRPPTLHKYNIQAFYPILVEGEALRINQLIANGFNADFDGDAMGIFAVLSEEALDESKKSMLSRYNLLKVADGTPIIQFGKDLVIGLYYLTSIDESKVQKDETKYKTFANQYDAMRAFNYNEVTLREPVRVQIGDQLIVTTAGRLIFNEITPEDFKFVNDTLNKKVANNVLKEIVLRYSLDESIAFLDKAKVAAFNYATISGFSVSMGDLVTAKEKGGIISKAKDAELAIQSEYNMGLIAPKEKARRVIELWQKVTQELSDIAWNALSDENPFKIQVTSGANGDKSQAAQIMAMQGIVRDPTGQHVQFPIIGNYTEGFNSYEYFVSSRGARKGQVDTALKTAQSGYMTRKLSDVAQDVIIRMEDCGYDGEGHRVSRNDLRELNFAERMVGRFLAQDVINPKDGKVLVEKGTEITYELAKKIDEALVDDIFVRSPMLCKAPVGMCAKCYGYDFGTFQRVDLGKAVGIIAAQSISEYTTQMTLRTFHAGGVGTDITMGIPRIVELFEAREPKFLAVLATIKGNVKINNKQIIISGEKLQRKTYVLNSTYEVLVEDNSEVTKGQDVFKMNEKLTIKSPFAGTVKINGNSLIINGTVTTEEVINIPARVEITVKDGDEVERGQALTTGAIDPKMLAELKGLYPAQVYVLNEIQKVLLDYGIPLRDVHAEVITRQMTKLAKIIDAGDTGYTRGTFINRFLADFRNEKLIAEGKKPMVYSSPFLGVTVVSLNAESILAAMSFQEQVKVLSEAAIVGRTDFLRGLKENVMIGRLIPVDKRAIISEVDKLEELSL